MGDSAYSWWFSALGTDSIGKPVIVDPQKSQKVWQKECQALLLYNFDQSDSEKYWSNIMKIITKITDDYSPDPNFDFAAFVSFIYQKKNFLSPKTLNDCIIIGEKFNSYTQPQKIAYTFPLICRNPMFFVDSLLFFEAKHKNAWNILMMDGKTSLAVFNMQMEILSASKAPKRVWKFRVRVANLLIRILEYAHIENPKLASCATLLLDKLCKMIPAATKSLQSTFVYIAILSVKFINRYSTKSEYQVAMTNMLNAAMTTGSYKVAVAYNCADQFGVSHNKILKMICSKGITSLEDIDIIYNFCQDIDPQTCISLINTLFSKATDDIVYTRICVYCATQVAIIHQKRIDVREAFTDNVRKMFSCIGYFTKKGINSDIVLVFCEVLSTIQHSELRWLEQSINCSVVTMKMMKTSPYYISYFFKDAESSVMLRRPERIPSSPAIAQKKTKLNEKKKSRTPIVSTRMSVQKGELNRSNSSIGLEIKKSRVRMSTMGNMKQKSNSSTNLLEKREAPLELIRRSQSNSKKPKNITGVISSKQLGPSIFVSSVRKKNVK